jgi:hypothetical protein
MNGISIHCAISILRRLDTNIYKQISDILATNNKELGSGWKRAIHNSQLFLTMYQFDCQNDLPLDRNIEIMVWKSTFPNYPQLMSWENNIRIYEEIIRPELHIQYVLNCLIMYSGCHVNCKCVYKKMQILQNPLLAYSDVINLIHVSILNGIDIARLINDLINIRNWPKRLNISDKDFWNLAFEKLTQYRPVTKETINNLNTFVNKYVQMADWNKEHIYQLIDYKFLDNHRDLWPLMDWQKIIKYIKLPEPILHSIMEQIMLNRSIFGKTINIAYIPTFQSLTEDFIERWFVNTLYDQDHIWANIFRSQKHLSEEFCHKYEHKQPEDSVSRLLNIIKSMQINSSKI